MHVIRKLAAVVAFLMVSASGAASGDSPGKPVYDKLCQSCHAPDGRGNPAKAKVLKIDPQLLNLGRDETANLSRDELKKILLEGKGKMPGYAKKLAPADVDPVLDHALELAKAIRGAK